MGLLILLVVDRVGMVVQWNVLSVISMDIGPLSVEVQCPVILVVLVDLVLGILCLVIEPLGLFVIVVMSLVISRQIVPRRSLFLVCPSLMDVVMV